MGGFFSRKRAYTETEDGVRVHRAGRPSFGALRKTLGVAGAFALSGLAGAAAIAIGLGGSPLSPDGGQALAPSDTNGSLSGLSDLLPPSDAQSGIAQIARPFDPAALGADSAENAPLGQEPVTMTLTVAPGNTLMTLLTGAGITRNTAYDAIQSLSDVFDPRGLKPKQVLELTLLPPLDGGAPDIHSLVFRPDRLRDIVVTRSESGFQAVENQRAVSEHPVRTDGTISSSLYVAAQGAGVPPNVLGDLIHIFSFDVDFQREVQPGDRFSLLFSERRTDEGDTVDFGAIVLAEMTVNGTRKRFYRFVDDTGRADYYDAKGKSVKKALLRTPIDGARISSGYGKRRHPILGYTKMHKGTDFAAPTGTPIYAAGDGVVEAAGWNGGYGNYIRIRHNGTYSTAYAHLNRIDGRIKIGSTVRQRQIIGYVGTTGRSTGPHLHYEVLTNGVQVNPLSVKLPTGKELSGAELARFERTRAEIDGQYASVEPSTQMAALPE